MKRFINKLSLPFRPKRFANELDEEMAFHREQTERELVEDFSLLVRTRQGPASIVPRLEPTVHDVNGLTGVDQGSSLEERINDSYRAHIHRSTAWLVDGFAALALLPGVVGLYGVIAR